MAEEAAAEATEKQEEKAQVSPKEQASAVAPEPRGKAKARGRQRRRVEHVQTPKLETIEKLRRHEKDVGSTEVQIGLLTDRILHLTEHLKVHRKDKHSNHGLLQLVSQRKRLLKYHERKDPGEHKKLKAKLNLR